MAEQAVRPSSSAPGGSAGARWRTVDIVVTAVLGVAFGVVFWAWNLLGELAVPPVSGLLNGVYLMPGVGRPVWWCACRSCALRPGGGREVLLRGQPAGLSIRLPALA